jgi:hypothetical protein
MAGGSMAAWERAGERVAFTVEDGVRRSARRREPCATACLGGLYGALKSTARHTLGAYYAVPRPASLRLASHERQAATFDTCRIHLFVEGVNIYLNVYQDVWP